MQTRNSHQIVLNYLDLLSAQKRSRRFTKLSESAFLAGLTTQQLDRFIPLETSLVVQPTKEKQL